jgi:hypothetical protein
MCLLECGVYNHWSSCLHRNHVAQELHYIWRFDCPGSLPSAVYVGHIFLASESAINDEDVSMFRYRTSDKNSKNRASDQKFTWQSSPLTTCFQNIQNRIYPLTHTQLSWPSHGWYWQMGFQITPCSITQVARITFLSFFCGSIIFCLLIAKRRYVNPELTISKRFLSLLMPKL